MLLVSNKDTVAAACARPGPRRQREPLTEKRVPGIGDLDHISRNRLLEGGIN